MVEFDVFRLELAAAFRSSARRRETWARYRAEGDDLRTELCERLASDAENLDLHVFLLCQLMFTKGDLAERFYDVRDELLSEIGTGSPPASATEFVRVTLRRTLNDAPPAWRIRSSKEVGAYERPSFRSGACTSRRSMPHARLGMVAIGDAALAWTGIVAPILSVWEFGRGASQSLVQRSSDLRSAVPATVISAEPVPSLRHPPAAYDAVVSFQSSPASTPCEAGVRIGGASAPIAGTMLVVVPRSVRCQTPLLPSDIGDPFATWALAAALMIGGVGAFKLRERLGAKRTVRRFVAIQPPGPTRAAAFGVGS